jgi:hypothetical protein
MRQNHARRVAAGAVLIAAFLPIAAAAHHTYVTKYNSAKKISLTGTIGSVRFSNPHIFFTLETAKGTWSVETESIPVVKAKGLTSALLKTGAKATVSGWPARSGGAELGLATISFAGGPSISVRGTPR